MGKLPFGLVSPQSDAEPGRTGPGCLCDFVLRHAAGILVSLSLSCVLSAVCGCSHPGTGFRKRISIWQSLLRSLFSCSYWLMPCSRFRGLCPSASSCSSPWCYFLFRETGSLCRCCVYDMSWTFYLMPLEYLESPLHALGGGVFFASGNSFFNSKPTGRFGLSPKPEVPICVKKC